METKKGTHLISNKGYLDSVRYLGLTTVDSMNELIDNSFDANADNIHIQIIEKDKKISLIIEDDGDGIASSNISEALSFGGRVTTAIKNRILTGRFGWGLSSAACCQTKRTEIYSKVKGSNYHCAYVDLDELKELDEPIIYDAKIKEPPVKEFNFKLFESRSGTIIILRDCDNLDRKTVNRLISLLIKNIGEVHRKYVIGGKKIFLNGKEIQLIDPLMLTPKCLYHDMIGLAEEYAKIEPVVIEENIDPLTNKPAEIKIKISLMNIQKIKKNEGWKGITKKIGLNPENQGFYLMRHNRQIAAAQSLGLYTKHPDFNYFRGEISFSPSLDRYFGIQTNKSRFSIDNGIKDKIIEKIKGVFEQMRKDVKKLQTKVDNETKKDEIKPSEKIAAQAEKLLKSSKHKPSQKELGIIKKEIEEKKQKEIEKVKQGETLTDKEKEEKIRNIENKFQFRRPFRLVLDYIESGDFYIVRPKGNDTEVVINKAHPFYNKVYERAVEKGLNTYIDLLLFTLAKAELEYYDKEEIKRFYQMQRGEWSAILNVYLDECFENEGDEDENIN